jgi:chemotaxis signal transduction protein
MADPVTRFETRFDWQRAQARIAALGERLQRVGALTPEEIKTVLTERARRYAAPPKAAAPAAEAAPALFQFGADGGRLAVEVGMVAAVLPFAGVAAVPCTPPHVRGLVHHAGRLTTVLDLAALVWPEGRTAAPRWIVVADVHGVDVAFVAETIAGLRRSAATDGATPAPGRAVWAATLADGTVVVDLRRLLADPRVRVDEDAIHITAGGDDSHGQD